MVRGDLSQSARGLRVIFLCPGSALRNVTPLFNPHRARLAELRQWFISQAQEPVGYVAALSVGITGDGLVNTSGHGIEPEHAAVMLDELKSVVARLEAIAFGGAPSEPRHAARQCQVIQLPYRSTIKAQA